MAGTICLQGGKEFGASCRDLDLAVLAATPIGPIVVLAGAARPGRDYATASRNAARYYGNLSGDPAVPAPDPREDLDGCLGTLAQAELIVLPGGSPTELLRVCTELGQGAVGDAVRARHAAGASVSGASAGAMVLCRRTWLADGHRAVDDGLGMVPGLALPHHQTGRDRGPATDPSLPLWGLPECGGVIITYAGVIAAGAGEPVLIRDDHPHAISRTDPEPVPIAPDVGAGS